MAYHFGIRYMCEVDIVLPEDMPLRTTHDIGESLEKKIEELSVVSAPPPAGCARAMLLTRTVRAQVERAFVHLDYEWTHKAEHKRVFGD